MRPADGGVAEWRGLADGGVTAVSRHPRAIAIPPSAIPRSFLRPLLRPIERGVPDEFVRELVVTEGYVAPGMVRRLNYQSPSVVSGSPARIVLLSDIGCT